MKWFKRIFGWLLDKPGPAARYGDPGVYAIDTDALAQELDLEAEARRLGEADLPRADETAPSGTEAAAVQRIEKARGDYLAWAAERLKALNQDIERHDVSRAANQAMQMDTEFERKAAALLNEHGALLQALRRTAQARAEELARFRERCGLKRAAEFPDFWGAFLRWSALLFLVVLEGGLNAFFFAQGLSSGYIGGFLFAALFAFLNVALAWFWGRLCLPYANHRRRTSRAFGALSLLLALGTALGAALLIAHFRDALGRDPENAAASALTSLRANPLSLAEVHSWLLFGVSLLFAQIALWDAYGLDDPYPGYGRRARAAEAALQDYREELDALRQSLAELKDETLAGLDEALDDCRLSLQRLHEAIEHKAATETRLHLAAADADHCLRSLLRKFRDINQLHRRSPRPAYFADLPETPALPWPDFSTARDRAKYRAQSERVEDLTAHVEIMRGRIQSAFNREYDRLAPLDAQFALQPGEEIQP
jgi:hypothetical protein